MPRTSMVSIIALGALVAGGCGHDGISPVGDTLLESLAFATDEVAVGEPLVLMARPALGQSLPTQPIVVRVSSGVVFEGRLNTGIDECVRDRVAAGVTRHMAERQCWRDLSAHEVAYLISIADENGIAIGFKEAEQEYGVDAEGHVLTSAETVEAMTRWVQDQGVTIHREFLHLPGISGSMAADAERVRTIRGHGNIDYLVPDVTGTFLAEGRALWAALPTSDPGSALGVLSPGDVVTAEYRQPDGSVLTAQVALK